MIDYTSPHTEQHKSHRSRWLRAAVLGVNDGIVSTASIMLGVTAAAASSSTVITTGIAALTAGALSMAVGEYVSVSSQKDSEKADIAIERRSLADNPDEELAELAWIYEQRGLDATLARQVANQLHDHDAVAAHARDELGIDHTNLAKPAQAALASACSFAVGAVIPIVATLVPGDADTLLIVLASLAGLGASGAVGAYIGGGHRLVAAARVFLGGGAAMALTALVGHIVGTAI